MHLAIFIVVLSSVASGIFSGFLAQEKRRDALSWAVLGFLFGPIALIAVGLSPAIGREKGTPPPLHEAVKRKDVQAVGAILNRHSDPDTYDSKNRTALMLAAEDNNIEIVELLVNHGASLEMKDSRGCTALGFAVQAEAFESVRILLSRGANVDSRDTHTLAQNTMSLVTPLQYASMEGHLEMVRLLVNNGAGLDCTAGGVYDGFTALHFAAKEGHLEVVRELIQSGAKVNPKDFKQYTPLVYAADRGRLAIVQVLLEAGAREDVSSIKSALSKAKSGRHEAIVDLLKKTLDHEKEKQSSQKKPAHPLGQENRSENGKCQSVGAELPSTLRIVCPHCKRSLSIPAHLRGTTGRCKYCGRRVRVPS